MPKYLILATGVGQGCDYTIGCNKTWWHITADHIEDAIEKLSREMWSDEGGVEDYENAKKLHIERYKGFEIVEVSDIRDIRADELIEGHYNAAKLLATEKAERDKESVERAEYQRLKKKFGMPKAKPDKC